MNKMNVTEAQLRSWRPRQPAAGLKRKILTAGQQATRRAAWLWGGLAPTMACALLTLMVLNHSSESPGLKPVMAVWSGSQSSAASAADSSQMAQNHLAGVTFDWTNRSTFKSIVGFTPTTNFSN